MRKLLVVLLLAVGFGWFIISKEDDTFRGTGAPLPPEFNLPPGAMAERARETRVDQVSRADSSGSLLVFLSGREPVDEESELEPSRVLGQAVDARGERVGGLSLSLELQDTDPELEDQETSRAVEVDGSGTFSLETHQTYLRFTCGDPRWMLLSAHLFSEGGRVFELLVVAAPTTHCAGTVIDSEGRPEEGAQVLVHGRIDLGGLQDLEPEPFERRATSDEEGHFDFGPVPLLQPTWIEVEAAERGSVRRELAQIDGGDLRLQLRRRAGG